jgi:hypothetical protein
MLVAKKYETFFRQLIPRQFFEKNLANNHPVPNVIIKITAEFSNISGSLLII